jgi:hypothetical protein
MQRLRLSSRVLNKRNWSVPIGLVLTTREECSGCSGSGSILQYSRDLLSCRIKVRCDCARILAKTVGRLSVMPSDQIIAKECGGNSIPHFPLMSHTHPTSTPSNFQLIFDNALKAYKKRTKNDILTHPLADRLKVCDSADSTLTVLQELVQELNQSQRSNQKWLDPTVNVLLAFSETLRGGVGSVCFRT